VNLLRNPVVTGVLAVGAVFTVSYQVWGDKLLRRQPAALKPSVAAVTPALPNKDGEPIRAGARPNQGEKAPTPGATAPRAHLDSSPLPAEAVDESFVAARFNVWVSAPLRDPFLLLQGAAEARALFAAETNSPVATWVLQAIWNQTDSRLAVIQDKVYRAGDVISGYKLIRIESDEVWFQGPWRNERLGFREPQKSQPAGNAKSPK
jgi:hypothetical protein